MNSNSFSKLRKGFSMSAMPSLRCGPPSLLYSAPYPFCWLPVSRDLCAAQIA